MFPNKMLYVHIITPSFPTLIDSLYYKEIFICVIDFRGYTVRRKWGPELEARVRRVLETYHNPDTAKKALQV
jgi:hypothetical protein